MKKDPSGEWEYLSVYNKGRGVAKMSFSTKEARYFNDNSIANGTAWNAMRSVVSSYPQSKVIMYVEIDKAITRVKYYNPNGEKKYTTWYNNEDFYPYIPQKQIFNGNSQ